MRGAARRGAAVGALESTWLHVRHKFRPLCMAREQHPVKPGVQHQRKFRPGPRSSKPLFRFRAVFCCFGAQNGWRDRGVGRRQSSGWSHNRFAQNVADAEFDRRLPAGAQGERMSSIRQQLQNLQNTTIRLAQAPRAGQTESRAQSPRDPKYAWPARRLLYRLLIQE